MISLRDLWRKGLFTLVLNEPFDKPRIKRLLVTGKNLYRYLNDSPNSEIITARTDAFDSVIVNGTKIADGRWIWYVPRRGDHIELLPATAHKAFSNAFIQKLNERDNSGGLFLKAVVLTETNVPLFKRYFVDLDRPIIFNGNVYNPLRMDWSGFEINASMSLPSMRVNVSNVGGEVVDYLEKNPILENDVEVQILHSQLLTDVTAVDSYKMQIQSIEGDDMVAQFNLGLNIGLKDMLPTEVITKDEFPGIVDDVVRINI